MNQLLVALRLVKTKKVRPKWWPVGPIVTGLVIVIGFLAWGLMLLFALGPFGAGFDGPDSFFSPEATGVLRRTVIIVALIMPFAVSLLAFDIYSTDVWPRWLRTTPTALSTKDRPRLRKWRKYVFASLFVVSVTTVGLWSMVSAAANFADAGIIATIGALAAASFAGVAFVAVLGVLVFLVRWLCGTTPMSPRDARWTGRAAIARDSGEATQTDGDKAAEVDGGEAVFLDERSDEHGKAPRPRD